jgi:hypothetical protein
MSNQINISQNNEQILNDIQSLQQMEQQLFKSLETNTNLTSQQKQQIIEKMNQLSNMRINLYQTLSGVNDFFKNALTTSVGTLKEQTVAISIIESELNKAKRRLQALETEKNNKIRLVEINDYYKDKYAEHSQLMKIIIFTLVPIIILAVLNNKGILPNTIYYILVVIISIIGGYFFWSTFASIIMRDNMNYQEYAWSFNPNSVNTTSTTSSTDPWLNKTAGITCVGETCCSDAMTYDSSLNKCVEPSNVESFLTESNINDILVKKQPNKYKNDYNMSSHIKESFSKSFINNSSIK